MRNKTLALALVAGGFSAVGSPAQALPSQIDAASVPFALAYGACIYAAPAPDCVATRDALLMEADAVLDRFYRADAKFAKRSLRIRFDAMDAQAAELARDDKTVGTEVIGFMSCVSSAIRDDASFQQGAFVPGNTAFESCRDGYDSYLDRSRSTNAVQRNVNYLRYIRRVLPNGPADLRARTLPVNGLLTERGPRD
ncbi:hypothetical protein [Qipengyuania sp.]|uniref:hypothetical protein n=1 Tax=Qipengyuania sp. TaxID=2004515 RepID=UPI0035C7A407